MAMIQLRTSQSWKTSVHDLKTRIGLSFVCCELVDTQGDLGELVNGMRRVRKQKARVTSTIMIIFSRLSI